MGMLRGLLRLLILRHHAGPDGFRLNSKLCAVFSEADICCEFFIGSVQDDEGDLVIFFEGCYFEFVGVSAHADSDCSRLKEMGEMPEAAEDIAFSEFFAATIKEVWGIAEVSYMVRTALFVQDQVLVEEGVHSFIEISHHVMGIFLCIVQIIIC